MTAGICCFDHAVADIPKSGTFDIDPTSEPTFDTIPFTGQTMYIWPFAAPDDDLYTGSASIYNLGELILLNGSVIFNDADQKTGNFGIRILSTALGPQTFEESILTLDLGSELFDVHLPEIALNSSEEMFFWVAQSGATYYSTILKGLGPPDMTATLAMSIGEEYLARVPEPVTLVLFGSGALILLGRRRGPSRVHRPAPQR
jgi:hypothetical protein